MLIINESSKSDHQTWDNYVLGHPKGLAYQLYAWKEAIERAYGFECHYFIAKEEGNVKGVFPLARIHLPFCKGNLVSLPYCDAGGILADSTSIADSLLNHALDLANGNGIRFVEIRSAESFGDVSSDNSLNTEKVRMLLPLSINSRCGLLPPVISINSISRSPDLPKARLRLASWISPRYWAPSISTSMVVQGPNRAS